MKKIVSIAAIALFIAGSSAFACGNCGCKAKKSAKATCCTVQGAKGKKACCTKQEKKACGKDCAKPCCVKQAESK